MRCARPGPVHVVGSRPEVGAAVARRFARAGHPVGLIARDPARLAALTLDLTGEGVATESYPADASDPVELARALAVLAERQGPAEVLCFGPPPDAALSEPVLETGAAELERTLALNVVGAAAAVRAVLPAMRTAGRGTLLFVSHGTVEDPHPDRAASAVAGAALRTYTALLSRALADTPLRVAHLVVVGRVEPERVADRLWQLHDAGGQGYTVLPEQ
ncbi:SDR family NAD(P)-dependent oxidoreductase [Streptomyces justiciae]|uniref:SDR family NAD(P)-dependent oxidoreductase n=1 Tax=Streptomyces justiciae TaxID=2780140 RepID=UPI00187EA60F|nr:SDR family NAD(P)-dependent oxidoreductase [Streptomyces justiciae]MBE8476377.1 SDR family NAD(P)-dependent oxidoreductase [Streptomyces justiciae]